MIKKIDSLELEKIKNILNENKDNLMCTHEWIIDPFNTKKEYEELNFNKYPTQNLKGYSAKILKNMLILESKCYDAEFDSEIEESFCYAEINDELVYGENYIDIICYSYEKEVSLDEHGIEFREVVVLRFTY